MPGSSSSARRCWRTKTSAACALLNTVGVAYFTMQDFEKAQALSERAQAFDQQLFPKLCAEYLAACAVYPEFWKTAGNPWEGS